MLHNYNNNILKNNKLLFNKIKQNNNLYKLMKYLEKYNNNQSTYYYTKILFYNNKMNFKGGATTSQKTEFPVLLHVLDFISRYNRHSYYCINMESNNFEERRDLPTLLKSNTICPKYIYCAGALIRINYDIGNNIKKYDIFYNEGDELDICACTITSADEVVSIQLQCGATSTVTNDNQLMFYLFCTLYEGTHDNINIFFINVYDYLNKLYLNNLDFNKHIQYNLTCETDDININYTIKISYQRCNGIILYILKMILIILTHYKLIKPLIKLCPWYQLH